LLLEFPTSSYKHLARTLHEAAAQNRNVKMFNWFSLPLCISTIQQKLVCYIIKKMLNK